MRTAHLPKACIHGRRNHLIRSKLLHKHTHRHHINNSVQLSNLMEMHLSHALSVHPAFSIRNNIIHCTCIMLYLITDIQRINNTMHLRKRGMIMLVCVLMIMSFMGMFMYFVCMPVMCSTVLIVRMLMAVFFMRMLMMHVHTLLLFTIYINMHMRACYAAFNAAFSLNHYSRQLKGIYPFNKCLLFTDKLQERSRQHIPCRTHT